MHSIIISNKQITKGRFLAERFLFEEQHLVDQMKSSAFPVRTISQVGTVKGGKRLPPNSNYVQEGIPYVRTTDIRDLRVNFNGAVYITSEQQKIISRYPLQYLDVVISIAGTIGEVGLVDEKYELCQFNENLARITHIHDANPMYITVYLASKFGQAHIKYLTGGAVQPKLSLENINTIELPIPPRPIQDRIAQVMQDAYATRRTKLVEAEHSSSQISNYIFQELNVNLAVIERKRTALRPISAIAGKRFDFEAVVTMSDLKLSLGHATTLRDIVSQVTERMLPVESCPEDDIHYIGLADIESYTGELVNFKLTRGSEILSSSPVFQPGDILFGRMRPYLNKVCLATFSGVCSGEAIVLRPDEQKVDPVFLHALLLSSITLDQVVPLQSGTSLPRVSAFDVLSVKLPIPDNVQRQKEIGEEITRRRDAARRLRAEAESVVVEAKARVERMILGDEAP